jgi:hypothetical protein
MSWFRHAASLPKQRRWCMPAASSADDSSAAPAPLHTCFTIHNTSFFSHTQHMRQNIFSDSHLHHPTQLGVAPRGDGLCPHIYVHNKAICRLCTEHAPFKVRQSSHSQAVHRACPMQRDQSTPLPTGCAQLHCIVFTHSTRFAPLFLIIRPASSAGTT